jgi:hypothetical protein
VTCRRFFRMVQWEACLSSCELKERYFVCLLRVPQGKGIFFRALRGMVGDSVSASCWWTVSDSAQISSEKMYQSFMYIETEFTSFIQNESLFMYKCLLVHFLFFFVAKIHNQFLFVGFLDQCKNLFLISRHLLFLVPVPVRDSSLLVAFPSRDWFGSRQALPIWLYGASTSVSS